MKSGKLRAWLELARISNLPTVWTNVLAGWFLAGGGMEWARLAYLLGGGSLLYTGGMFLNDAADAKWDRENRKERPLPAGLISPFACWTASIAFMAAGFVMFVRGAEACEWLTGSLAAAIVLYDLFHKPWSGSVFIMGSCRTLLLAATGSAVTGTLSWGENHELLAKAIALGGYIVGVTLIARHESKPQHSSSVLRAIGTIGLASPVVVGLFYCVWHRAFIAAGFAMFPVLVIATAMRWMREDKAKIGRAVGLLLAGIVLVDALEIATVARFIPFIFVAAFPMLILWQRKIAAT